MKLIEKITKLFLNIILTIVIILIILTIYSFIQLNILKQEYNTFFCYSIFNISSGSMKEAIQVDDLIITKEEENLVEGDIITFLQDDQIVTHRIIEVLDNGNLITKGDANNSKDKIVEKQNVIGKVIKILPGGGVWIKVFSDKKVITCIVITLFFIGITIGYGDNKQDKKKRKRNHFSGFIKNVRGNLINEKKKEKP